MRTYRIGRGEGADVVVADASISRDHADLIEAEGGKYYWIDRNSSNGSFRRQNGIWVRLSKDYITENEPIRLGSYETTVARLLAGSAPRQEPKQRAEREDVGQMAAGPMERDSFGIPRPKKS